MIRWSAKRKAFVVETFRTDAPAALAFMRQYEISHEELIQWQMAYDQGGVRGLRVTKRNLNGKD